MEHNQHQGQPLTQDRKVGFIFLLLFAIVTVSMGALQLRNTIYGPFVIRRAETDLGNNVILADEMTRLQSIDTDQDGLNDYEELYFTETSPYLEDTDSDGIEDKAELDQGLDPLCPEGQDCSGVDPTLEAEAEINVGSDILPEVESLSGVVFGEGGPNIAGPAPSFDLQQFLDNPQLLRQTVLSTGKISAEDLAHISDQELLAVVENILA